MFLLFRHQRSFNILQEPEKKVEILLEPIKPELFDEPIKLAQNIPTSIGEPAPSPILPEVPADVQKPAEEPQEPVEDEPEEQSEEKEEPAPEIPLPDTSKLEPQEKLAPELPAKEEKKPQEKKKPTKAKKTVKSRYARVPRQTMPGFFEKMKNASQNSGDTLFIEGDPGVEKDLLQMKLQSYLRKLPWYLTQSFNIQQHDLRKLLKTRKDLIPLTFSVTINKAGDIIKLALIKSTGSDEVDKLMFDIIRSASPFPFIPESLRRERLSLPGTLDPYVMSQGATVIIKG